MADQVPFGVSQITECFRFALELLNAVFAEDAQTRRVSLPDPLRFYGFTDRHERDGIGAAAVTRRSLGNALANLGNILSDGHAEIIGVRRPKTSPRMNTDTTN